MTSDFTVCTSEPNGAEWKARVFQKEHYERVIYLTRKRFPADLLFDEALLYVLNGLAANNWEKVRQFQGRSSFKTFLGTVVGRLLTDFARTKFPDYRPPKWVSDLGAFWVRIYRLLCLQRLQREEVLQAMAPPSPGAGGGVNVDAAISIILEKVPECGHRHLETVSVDPEILDSHSATEPALHELSPEQALNMVQVEIIFRAVCDCLTVEDGAVQLQIDQCQLQSKLVQLRAILKLADEETLFLSLFCRDGYSVSSAGRVLGWGTDQASGRFRRLRDRINQAMEKVGLRQELINLLH